MDPAPPDEPVAEEDPFAETPERLVPADGLPSEPPVVRLTPDGRAIPVEVPDPEPAGSEFPLPGEPDKVAPSGFGQDPFAPDPAMYADPPVE
jgi:hypothetical protein